MTNYWVEGNTMFTGIQAFLSLFSFFQIKLEHNWGNRERSLKKWTIYPFEYKMFWYLGDCLVLLKDMNGGKQIQMLQWWELGSEKIIKMERRSIGSLFQINKVHQQHAPVSQNELLFLPNFFKLANKRSKEASKIW